MPGFGGFVDARQQDGERGSGPHRAVDGGVAPGLLHDAVHGREPESCPLARRLGREERLEDPAHGLLVHADAGVAYLDGDVVPLLQPAMIARVARRDVPVRGLHEQLTAGRHGVARVHREVHQHLRDLTRVGAHCAQILIQRSGHRDVLADQAAENLLAVAHHGIQVDDARLQHLLAAEREQLLRE